MNSHQRREEFQKVFPVFLIEKEAERVEENLMKEGNARCVFVPQKPWQSCPTEHSPHSLKVDDNDSPLSKTSLKQNPISSEK